MSVQIKQLKEENIRSKRSLVGMHRVLRARKHIEALGEDSTAEELPDAVSDCIENIIRPADDIAPATRRAMLMGALGSQQDVTKKLHNPPGDGLHTRHFVREDANKDNRCS